MGYNVLEIQILEPGPVAGSSWHSLEARPKCHKQLHKPS
jgi:hypothetical protein